MNVSDVTAALTGEGMFGKYTGGYRPPTRDQIAQLAYQIYERRGRKDGKDVDDWLSAEQVLMRRNR